MSQTIATLCRRCRALRFDDLALGGREAKTENGVAVLELPLQEPDWGGEGNIPVKYWLTDTYPELPKLEAGASFGCGFCWLLRASIRELVKMEGESVIDISIEYRWSVSARSRLGLTGMIVHLRDRNSESAVKKLRPLRPLRFLIDGNPDGCSKWLNLKPQLIPNTLHPANVDMIQQEIAHCQHSHTHNVDNVSNFLPTRLIAVGDDSRGVPPQLVITDYRLKRRGPRYAALSYCWGPPSDARTQSKTTAHTLEQRMAGFTLESISNVIRDTILVARTLSVPYLWIDSLCIVQGDRLDWERESCTIKDVYRHAYLTICTVASPSCHVGFLDRRLNSITMQFESKINPTIQGTFNLRTGGFAHPGPYVYKDSDFTFEELSEESILDTKWSQRAWTFQEKMLSARKLTFGSLQLSFSCPDRIKSDTGISWLPGHLNNCLTRVSSSPEFRHDDWDEIIMMYADLDLCYETDRLPAISGMARLMGFGSENYLAGLWRRFLTVGLCWVRDLPGIALDETRRVITRPHEVGGLYIAPSWSWATRKQGIGLGWSPYDSKDETVSITGWTVPKGLDPFGEVKDGLLMVHGKLLPLPSNIIHDLSSTDRWGSQFNNRCVFKGGQRIAWVGPDWHVSKLEEDGDELSMLLLTSSLRNYGGPRQKRCGRGIILHPSQIRDKYIRVGCFETTLEGFALFRRLEYQIVEVV